MSALKDIFVQGSGLKDGPVAEYTPNFATDYGLTEFSLVVHAQFEKMMAQLHPYLLLTESPHDFNDEHQRMALFGKLSFGFRKAGEYASWAETQKRIAERKIKEAGAIAAMDDFPEYVQSQAENGRQVKTTDAVMKSYVDMSPRVMKAIEHEAFVNALASQLYSAKTQLKEAIGTIRAMVYGPRDSSSVSSLSNPTET